MTAVESVPSAVADRTFAFARHTRWASYREDPARDLLRVQARKEPQGEPLGWFEHRPATGPGLVLDGPVVTLRCELASPTCGSPDSTASRLRFVRWSRWLDGPWRTSPLTRDDGANDASRARAEVAGLPDLLRVDAARLRHESLIATAWRDASGWRWIARLDWSVDVDVSRRHGLDWELLAVAMQLDDLAIAAPRGSVALPSALPPTPTEAFTATDGSTTLRRNEWV